MDRGRRTAYPIISVIGLTYSDMISYVSPIAIKIYPNMITSRLAINIYRFILDNPNDLKNSCVLIVFLLF